MYTKVIVPLDGSELSEQALPYARLVARSIAAPIELVQAYDILPPRLLGSRARSVVAQLEDGARSAALAELEPARQRLAAAGHSVSTAARRGPAADAIAAHAGADPAALVVMCTHGRGGISRWVMGSVTDKVLHTIPNPMLIVRAAAAGSAAADRTAPEASPEEASPQDVVVPLDGSELSELALPHAVSIAAALSAGIAVLRITPTEGYYRRELVMASPEMGAIPDFDPLSANELVAEDAAGAASYLSDVRNRLETDHAGSLHTEHIVHDNIAQTIIDRAAARPALVAMSTHGRSGVGRVVLGSITDRVVRHGSTPVLVIR